MYHCFSACSDGLDRGQQRKGSAGEEFFQAASDAGGYYSDSVSGTKTAELNQGVAGLSQLIKIFCNDIIATLFYRGLHSRQVVLNAPEAFVLL